MEQANIKSKRLKILFTKVFQFVIIAVGDFMNNADYKRQKLEYAYSLFKQRKFFKKARAVVVDNGKLLLIEVTYLNGVTDDLARNPNRKSYSKHYLLPGGGIDEGETPKQASVREAFEEYGVNVKPVKYLGKSYYTVPMNIDGEDFKSNRVEYYYLCKITDTKQSERFGLSGEFEAENKIYRKVKLTLNDIKKLDPSDINDMNSKVYNELVSFLSSK